MDKMLCWNVREVNRGDKQRIIPKNGEEFDCSFIYAHNSQCEKKILWVDLCQLARSINGPWILMGDFNCVLNTNERIGSAVRLQEMQDFHNCTSMCAIEDAKYCGNFSHGTTNR